MTTQASDELSQAIIVWSGWGDSPWPVREESRLIDAYGKERAAELMPQVLAKADLFYESDARFVARDLAEMGDRAIADFRREGTELTDAALEVLAWCYTYDYK